MEAFEEQKLSNWKGITELTTYELAFAYLVLIIYILYSRDLIQVSLDSGLLEAVKMLIENKIHRYPI